MQNDIIQFFRENSFLNISSENVHKIQEKQIIIKHPGTIISKYMFFEYECGIGNLAADDILKRQEVVKNFLFYTEKSLQAMFQCSFGGSCDVVYINGIKLFVKQAHCYEIGMQVSAGFWYLNTWSNGTSSSFVFGFDIISLYAYMRSSENIQYCSVVREWYDFFSSREFVKREKEKEFYLQECNPMSLMNTFFADLFIKNFKVINIVKIINVHSRIIGLACVLKTISGEVVELYYTFWRHIERQAFDVFPLPPQRKNSLILLQPNSVVIDSRIAIFESLFDCSNFSDPLGLYVGRGYVYEGIKNLQYVESPLLRGVKIFFYLKKKPAYTDLVNLHDFKTRNGVQDCFVGWAIEIGYSPLLKVDVLLEKPEMVDILKPVEDSFLFLPEDEIAGSFPERYSILEPIIKSSTITWFYATQKSGKTLFALFLAQMIATGNKSFGPWHVTEPRKVLYIDGEMPGDMLDGHIKKIIKGMDDYFEEHKRKFSIHLFSELKDIKYESILDDGWKENFLTVVQDYDLVILDNFYTLHASLNPIPLINWMKEIVKNGVAFLVIDHTNSKGFLQGSLYKQRAMDLGIKFERMFNNCMISYENDRYGVGIDSEISFSMSIDDNTTSFKLASKDESKIHVLLAFYDLKELFIFIVYILKKNDKLNKEIAGILKISEGQVSKYLKTLGFNSKLECVNSNTHVTKVRHEIEEDYLRDKDFYDRNIDNIIKQALQKKQSHDKESFSHKISD